MNTITVLCVLALVIIGAANADTFGSAAVNRLFASHQMRSMKSHAASIKSVAHALENPKVVTDRQADDAVCNAFTTCAACTAGNNPCVWTPTAFARTNADGTQITSVGFIGKCWPGNQFGPIPRTDDINFFEIDVDDDDTSNGGSGGDNKIPIWWGAGVRTCAAPFRQNKINTESDGPNGIVMKEAITFPSTYGPVIDIAALRAAGELEEDSVAQKVATLRVLAPIYRGVIAYFQMVIGHAGPKAGNPNDLDRAGLAMFFLGFELSDIFEQFIAIIQKGGSEDDFNPLKDGGVRAVAFLAVFNNLIQFPFQAGTTLTVDTAGQSKTPITGLALTAQPVVTMGSAKVYQYTMAGTLAGTTQNFRLDCYMGTDEFQHAGRAIDPATFECDVTMTGLDGSKATAINLVLLPIDMNALAAGAANANVDSVDIGSGGEFTIVATAKATAAATATFNVLGSQDKTCKSVEFLTDAALAGIKEAFGGRVTPLCLYYTFDAATPTIYWDPATGVDEAKATAAVSAGVARQNAGVSMAPSVITVLLLSAIMLVFGL